MLQPLGHTNYVVQIIDLNRFAFYRTTQKLFSLLRNSQPDARFDETKKFHIENREKGC